MCSAGKKRRREGWCVRVITARPLTNDHKCNIRVVLFFFFFALKFIEAKVWAVEMEGGAGGLILICVYLLMPLLLITIFSLKLITLGLPKELVVHHGAPCTVLWSYDLLCIEAPANLFLFTLISMLLRSPDVLLW